MPVWLYIAMRMGSGITPTLSDFISENEALLMQSKIERPGLMLKHVFEAVRITKSYPQIKKSVQKTGTSSLLA